MINKILAGLAMGVVAALLSAMLVGLISGGGNGGADPATWSMAAGFVLVLILALTARSGKRAWGRGALVNGLLSFLLPLSGLIFSAVVGTKAISEAPLDAASQAGTAIGTGLGGILITGMLGVIGLFLGLFFVVLAFFLLRGSAEEFNR